MRRDCFQQEVSKGRARSTRLWILPEQLGDSLPILGEADLRLGTRLLETRQVSQQALLFLLEFSICASRFSGTLRPARSWFAACLRRLLC